MPEEQYRICTRCVSDTTIPGIRFDEQGVCQFCHSHDRLLQYYPQDEASLARMRDELVAKVKEAGAGKPYDCIVGISGGTDSTYTLYMAKQLGLRPLAVHFDNGWNTDTAVTNIHNATKKLGVDLYTYVVDWEEFKSLQVAFLKSADPGIEVPTDVAIHGTLFRAAAREGVRYILGGQSFMTEGTVPREWSFIDGTFVKSVNRKLGTRRLKSYPNATIYQIAYYLFVRRIRQIPFLNLFHYDKAQARAVLERELDWKYYGGHHYENLYSHFAFGWYLYNKFGIDKRKISLSGPVRMGHMARAAALEELQRVPPVDLEVVKYCVNKLGLTEQEFEAIMALPNKTFHDYHTSYPVMKTFAVFLRLAVKMGIVTPVLYEKFVAQ